MSEEKLSFTGTVVEEEVINVCDKCEHCLYQNYTYYCMLEPASIYMNYISGKKFNRDDDYRQYLYKVCYKVRKSDICGNYLPKLEPNLELELEPKTFWQRLLSNFIKK